MKSALRLTGAQIALIILIPFASFGQQIEAPDLWLARSQTITGSLVKDVSDLKSFDQAILFARLGDAWWKDDQEQASSWMRKAIEILEYIPEQQSPADRSRRLATARTMLSIIAPRDEKLGRRVTEMIFSSSEHDSSAERKLNADALVEEALAIVDRDPQRATALGAESLRVGRSSLIAALLWELRSRDAKLADDLFMQSVAAVRDTYDLDFFSPLLRVAFPILSGQGPKAPAPPDAIRFQLLLAVAAYFEHILTTTEASSLCSASAAMISMIAPVLPEFDRLLPPAQSSSVHQLIVGCQSGLSPIVQERVEDAQRNVPLKTVDDFLNAADKAKYPKAKTVLQLRAAQLAVRQKDFDRAISIIDEMDDDARKFLNGAWEGWRSEWAVRSALDHITHDDFSGAHRVIAATPASLRATAQIGVAYELPPKESNRPLAIELIQAAREGLAKSDLPIAEKATWSIVLLGLYARLLPADAFAVLKETVTVLNRIPSGEPGDTDSSELANTQALYNLPVSMLESDEFAFLGAVSSVESPTKRARMRLELLSASLDKHRASIAPKKTPSRGGHGDVKD